MLEYVHFIPGRLRLKLTELRHRRRATEAEAYISSIPAVTSAVANPMTGSLTIRFDQQQLPIRDLWEQLAAQGYVPRRSPPPTAIGRPSSGNRDADQPGRAVMTAIIEAVVQHSAHALVRALL